MVAPVKVNLKVYQGSTFAEIFRWESYTKVYKPITGITKAAPAVVTAVGHGMPVGWRFKVSDVLGMKEINTDEYHVASSVSADTVTISELNSSLYTTYTSGGNIEYNEPKSLYGITARMQIRSKLSSTEVLLELTTENSMIILDDSAKTIVINIPAVTTATLDFKTAVYSMELVNGATVVPFIHGNIVLDKEVTR